MPDFRLGRTVTAALVLGIAGLLPLIFQAFLQESQIMGQRKIFLVVTGSLVLAWIIDAVLNRTRKRRQSPPATGPQRSHRTARRAYVIPSAIPPPPGHLVGRDEELRTARHYLSGSANGDAVRTVVIMGDPGVGKSALAITAAHALVDEYVDGQIFIRLDSQNNSTAFVLQRLLAALYDPNDEKPAKISDLDFYRHRTAGRRLLVVLDNVTSNIDLQAALPNSRQSSLIVTTREHVIDVDGNRLDLTLRPLDVHASRELLVALLGEARVRAEPEAVSTLVTDVHGYPAAMRIAGAVLATRVNWSLEHALVRRDDVTRARGGGSAQGPFDSILDLAFALLTEPEQDCLRLVGVAEERTLAPWMLLAMSRTVEGRQAAALSSESAAERVLETFSRVRLAERRFDAPSGVTNYRIPAYVHAYAARQAPGKLNKRQQRSAREELKAERLSRFRQNPDYIVRTKVYRLLDAGELTAALESARQTVALAEEILGSAETNSGAATNAALGHALAQAALAEVYSELGWLDEAQTFARSGLAASTGQPPGVVRALRVLGGVARKRGQAAEAVAHLRDAASACGQLNDPAEYIRVQRELSVAFVLAGQNDEALNAIEKAASLCDQIGEKGFRRKPGVLWASAVVLTRLKSYAPAEEQLAMAETLLSATNVDDEHPARSQRLWRPWIRYENAVLALNTGRLEQCRESALMALDDFTAMNHRYGSAQARLVFGIACLKDGRVGRAVPALEESLDNLRSCGDRRRAAHAALALASAYFATQRQHDAERLFRSAEDSLVVLGDKRGHAAATRHRKQLEADSADAMHHPTGPAIATALEHDLVA
jgi:tetratricopeptide (TPR) repeat protein